MAQSYTTHESSWRSNQILKKAETRIINTGNKIISIKLKLTFFVKYLEFVIVGVNRNYCSSFHISRYILFSF